METRRTSASSSEADVCSGCTDNRINGQPIDTERVEATTPST